MVYRIYISECLRTITENTARFAGGNAITAKFADLVDPKPVDDTPPEEMIIDLFDRAGIEMR